MTRARTANLLGALSTAVSDRLAAHPRRHPNEKDSSAAALHLIGDFDGCSNLELSQALRRSHPATVRLVDKLEREGLVSSGPSSSDGRSVALHLTPAGRARERVILDERREALGALLDVLSAEQCRQLDEIAATLLRALVHAPVDAAFTCRLCDQAVCADPFCPVHDHALALAAAQVPPPARRSSDR